MVRDPRQFLHGNEPTRTSPWMIFDSVKAILIKKFFKRGKGVLEIEGTYNTKTRERYLQLIKKKCPDCTITEIRESHGTTSYLITYPDAYSFGSSLDAGALEWQTKPSPLTAVRKNLIRQQNDIYNLARDAGARLKLNMLGGHVTVSGFNGDTFWFGNMLKFRANNTYLDWGFFGKDDYNAKPVALWAQDQQVKYAAVHAEHDLKYANFLKKLETALNQGASDSELMKVFSEREVMTSKEYSDALANIYRNPAQDDPSIGKRSKPKYVATRPAVNKIEYRAIAPQDTMDDFLKEAEFIESEAWYIKEKMNAGYTLYYTPTQYKEISKSTVSRMSKKTVTELGLDWNNYVRFSKAGEVDLKGDEKNIADDFVKVEYGAAKRDLEFRRLRDHFLAKPEWSRDEVTLMSDLMSEMSYTIQDALENATLMASRISTEAFSNATAQGILKLTDRFPLIETELTQSFQGHFQNYVLQSFTQLNFTETRAIAGLMNSDHVQSTLGKIRTANYSYRPEMLKTLGDLILKSTQLDSDIENYLRNINTLYARDDLIEPPTRFHEIAEIAFSHPHLADLARDAEQTVVQWAVRNGSRLKLTDEDAALFIELSKRHPELVSQILVPLRNHYHDAIVSNQFGIKNYYNTIVYFELLNEITPDAEKMPFLEEMLKGTEGAHEIMKNPDSLSFIEKVQNEMEPILTDARCTRIMRGLRIFFGF